MALVSMLTLLWALGYCVARTIIDFRQHRFWWAAAGAASALVIATAPFPKPVLTIDLSRH